MLLIGFLENLLEGVGGLLAQKETSFHVMVFAHSTAVS